MRPGAPTLVDKEFEYHRRKRTDKTYFSSTLPLDLEGEKRFRIASKVIDSSERWGFVTEHDETVLRITQGGRQEVVARFLEDDRHIFMLTFQRFTTRTGKPH